jgi:hypothetical protein
MRNTLVLLAVLISVAALPAAAQMPPQPQGGAVVQSEPGRATVARAVEVSARVVALNKAERLVTLKGPKGDTVDVVAGDEVKNFDQIKVGDLVVVRYLQSLSLALRKTKGGAPADISQREMSAQAKPGERPAAGAAREVTAIAKVTHVDKKAKTITLKGPRGNVVTLDVQNPEQFKVVKVGDEVDVVYTEAVAISVEPAPKKDAASKKK